MNPKPPVDTYGQPLGDPGYRLIDADSHVNEPPGLWIDRVPAGLVDRVPHMRAFDEGDAWVMEGVDDPINFGLNAAAGLPVDERKPWVKWDDLRAGGCDPKARLEEMDVDLVDASILYPTPRISQLMIGTEDPGLHLAMVRAYNDWLSEYCEHDPSRLGGLYLVPNRGIADAVAEIERVGPRPGLVGALIGCYPHGDLDLAAEDDAVWQAIVDQGHAAHIHVGLKNSLPTNIYAGATMTQARAQSDLRFMEAPVRMLQFVGSGVFDRIPQLKVVLGEVDAGWVPYVKEQMDNRAIRRTPGSKMRVAEMPSAVVSRHFFYTYITDHFAIRNRHAVGVDRLMWSSDFPHSGSDWPSSARVIHASFADVEPAERDAILAGNAQSLYGFGS
jgi:predicted TIM-barrel fold metal-dependent hydrolase